MGVGPLFPAPANAPMLMGSSPPFANPAVPPKITPLAPSLAIALYALLLAAICNVPPLYMIEMGLVGALALTIAKAAGLVISFRDIVVMEMSLADVGAI